jgi:hypothetical protein
MNTLHAKTGAPRFVPVGPSWPPGAACPGPISPPSTAASTGWQPSLITIIRSISSRGNHGTSRVRKSESSTSSYTGTFLNLLYLAVLGYQITYPKCYLTVTEDNFQTCKIILVFRVCFTVSSLDHFRTTMVRPYSASVDQARRMRSPPNRLFW